jgi:type IV pilus assembly protein PilW
LRAVYAKSPLSGRTNSYLVRKPLTLKLQPNWFTQPRYECKKMMQKHKGLSLVELMISITLGLILLTGVMKVFLSSKTVFSTQQALSRVQESGRLAIEFISRDVRMAGYMGCASRTADLVVTNTLNTPTNFRYDFGSSIIGYSAATVGAAYTLVPTPTANTDIIVLRSASGNGNTVAKNNNGAQLFATDKNVEANACADGTDRVGGLCKNDILVVSDCTKATIFQATLIQDAGPEVNVVHSGAAATPGNAISSWGGSSVNDTFGPGAEILSATNTAYFIGTGTSGRPSLWQNVNGTNLELLESVEKMSVLYGVDTNDDFIPNDYRKAAAVAAADWDKVVSVRIELLVASIEDNVLPELQKYRFDGVDNVSPVPADRRLRQVFTTTIGIRSRSF